MSTLHWDAVAPGARSHVAVVPLTRHAPRSAPHDHADFYELMYVMSGHGWHETTTARHELVPGDLVLVRPHDQHTISTTGLPVGPRGSAAREALTFANIAFPAADWQSFLALAAVPGTADWDSAALGPMARAEDHRLAAAVSDLLERPSLAGDSLALIRLWTASVELFLRNNCGGEREPRPAWLVRACTEMELEPNLRAGLPAFVRLAGVTPGHLNRAVRTHFGCTAVEYVNRCRLGHAAVLLRRSTIPIAAIATRCGFTSAAYFGRVFQRAHGVSPGQFRATGRQTVLPSAVSRDSARGPADGAHTASGQEEVDVDVDNTGARSTDLTHEFLAVTR